MALGTGSEPVLAASAGREKVEFYNPNLTTKATLWVATSPFVAASNGAGSIPVLPGGALIISGSNVNCAWNACADASGANLTILEYLQ